MPWGGNINVHSMQGTFVRATPHLHQCTFKAGLPLSTVSHTHTHSAFFSTTKSGLAHGTRSVSLCLIQISSMCQYHNHLSNAHANRVITYIAIMM